MTRSTLFSDAMALEHVGDGRYMGELNAHWTIGPKLHGGVMLSLCAAAARAAHGGPVEPVAVSANYLSASDPGPMVLQTSVRKRGRTVSVVDVELMPAGPGPVGVHAVVTLGTPEHDTPPLLSCNPVLGTMSPQPPPGVESIGPGHPMGNTVNFATGCDIRPLLSTVPDGQSRAGEPPVIRYWVRPRGMAPDILFALLCGDVSVPVAFAVGRRGWAPTVQLTAYLRGRPADGWLRVMCTTTQIGRDWFDEDHVVVDCAGRIVVQTRQLALVPNR